MTLIIGIALGLIVIYLTLINWVLMIEVILGSAQFGITSRSLHHELNPEDIGVLIPAHDESATIENILADLKKAIPLTRVLVVADNCTDDTAAKAQAMGATVSERFHDTERGKGFALAHGVSEWTKARPRVLIFLDADCRLQEGTLSRLAQAALTSRRPVQAEYLMHPHPNEVQGQSVSTFAWFLMNAIRQRGLSSLNAPARLNGTGMAMTWDQVMSLDLATDHLVEDTMMGIDLALAGSPAQFLPSAQVTSTFPSSQDVEIKQRQRWESGQGQALYSQAPKLLGAAFRSPGLFISVLDLAIPPLTRLAAMLLLTLVTSALFGVFTGIWGIAQYALVCTGMFSVSLVIAYFVFQRHFPSNVTLNDMLAFVLLKLKVAKAGKAGQWVRTGRDNEQSD